MARSVFEIIVETEYSSVTQGIIPFTFFLNQELIAPVEPSFLAGTLGQHIPIDWSHQGFVDLPQVVTGAVTPIENSDFESNFSFDTTVGSFARSSFYSPNAWDVTMHSIPNSGMSQDGSSLSEDTSTNGYPYFNGNSIALKPTLNLVSKISASPVSIAARIGVYDNFLYAPDMLDEDELSTYDHTINNHLQAYSMLPNQMYEFGSYRTLNIYSTAHSDNSVYVGGNVVKSIRVVSKEASLRGLELSWGWVQTDSLYTGSQEAIASYNYSKYEGIIAPAQNGLPTLKASQPTAVRLANIFSDEQIGDTVSVKFEFIALSNISPRPQELVGAYTTSAANQFTANALEFNVDTPTGTLTASTFTEGTFRPYEIFNTGSGFSDMTEEISISEGRLRLKTTTNAPTAAITEIDLMAGQAYILSMSVATTQHSISLHISKKGSNNLIEMVVGEPLLGTFQGADVGDGELASFKFNTSSGLVDDGAGGYEKQKYRLWVVAQGDAGLVTEINYIRFEAELFPFAYERQFVSNIGGINPSQFNHTHPSVSTQGAAMLPFLGDLIVTTSDVNDHHLKAQSIVEDSNGDLVPNDYSPSSLTSPDYVAGAASVRTVTTFFNPTTEAPLFNEDESGRIGFVGMTSFDDDGQAITIPTDTYEVTFEMKIGSRNLSIFADSITSDRLGDFQFGIASIEFLTSENSYISQDPSGGDKIELVYKPSLTDLAPPFIVSQTELPQAVASSPKTLSWDVSSLSGDSLMIDFGDGSTATEVSSSGTGSATVTPNGQNLRIRVISETEKGSALVDTVAVINSVGLADGVDVLAIKSEPYGDVQSINSTLPHIGAYAQGLRVYSYNHATGSLLNHAGGESISQFFEVEQMHSFGFLFAEADDSISSTISFDIEVLYLGSDNYIEVTDYLGASAATTTISSTGITTITRAGRDFESSGGTTEVSIKFLTDGFHPLDVILGSVSISNDISSAVAGTILSLDLGDEVEIPLNFSVKDFSDISKTSGDFSKTIQVPATSKNKKALNFKNELNSLNETSDSLGINCIIKADGLEVVKGKLKITESSLNQYGFEELYLNIKAGNSGWADALSQINLRDIGVESDYVPVSFYNIMGGLGGNEAITFPLIDNGRWEVESSQLVDLDKTHVGWSNIKAAFSIRQVLDRIFEAQGVIIESDFLDADSEWSSDFGSEFSGLTSKIYGLAPEMKHHEDDIENSKFKATRSLVSSPEQSNWHTASSKYDNRPIVRSKILGEQWAWTIDWSFSKFSEIIESGNTGHSYTTLSGGLSNAYVPEGAGGNANTTQGYPICSLLQGGTNEEYSSIVVAKSGFYEVNFQAAVDFEIWDAYGFNSTFSSGSKYVPDPEEHYFTCMLISQDESEEGITQVNEGSWGANLFDLEDDASQELPVALFTNTGTISLGSGVSATTKRLNSTRITLNRIQYLKAGVSYLVGSFMGCHADVAKASTRKVLTNSKFTVNEIDLDLKLAESIHPMNGKEAIVYNSNIVPRVSFREILPDISCLDFVSEITKLFNLIWTYNPYTSVLSTEPYGEFYDFDASDGNYIDWSDKALITKIKEGAVASSDFYFKMNEDSSDASTGEIGGGLVLGDKIVRSGTDSEKKAEKMELKVFSACRMDTDSHLLRNTVGSPTNFIGMRMPRIYGKDDATLEANINEEKPEANNSHEYKLLYQGEIDESAFILAAAGYAVHYGLSKQWLPNGNQGTYEGEFRFNSQETPFTSNYYSYDLIEGSPNLSFSEQVSGTSLFTNYHKKLFDMVKFRDKMITAQVHLTTYDILNLDFSKLVRINEELYLVNKVKDFNFSGETTEVELLLVTIIE